MNKIYSEPVVKAMTLVEGVKKQADLLQKKGITVDVDKLQELCRELEQAGKAQDEAEAKLKDARLCAHGCLEALKELYTASKMPIKQNFPPETWSVFGVLDKK